ncbi:hypothetical protein IV38_GL000122 [Lactobacillus selangorensis]|uniref:SGNH hydrolase-type esterase domain-containing protein n=1 Tax=Lactobacillus selangorensis TaxID=81857 RepID=A0A0R2FSV2_9LACO|nr:hypothetical protein IV38_GL000122 [Lactobacillus selangorensis]KRN31400.1 hypothetical protein IV40_GL001396 [Lactobacillus selangorensis]
MSDDDFSKTEKLVIFGGHNDFHQNKPLGKLGDTTGDTFYGAYEGVIKSALASNPKLKIYLVTPNWRIVDESDQTSINKDIDTYVNGAGATFGDYTKAIEDLGAKYHLPVLNLYKDWGVFRGNRTVWLVDNLHPNDAGQKWLAEKINGFIESN